MLSMSVRGFFNATGSVRPFFVFFLGGEYVCPSYAPLKIRESAKSGRKSVRPFIIKLWNPYFPKKCYEVLKLQAISYITCAEL